MTVTVIFLKTQFVLQRMECHENDWDVKKWDEQNEKKTLCVGPIDMKN